MYKLKYYFYFFLTLILISFPSKTYPENHNLNEVIEKATQNVNPNVFYTLLFAAYTVCVLIIIGVIWLFYKLLYGILLKRLNRNYKELEKLDL